MAPFALSGSLLIWYNCPKKYDFWSKLKMVLIFDLCNKDLGAFESFSGIKIKITKMHLHFKHSNTVPLPPYQALALATLEMQRLSNTAMKCTFHKYIRLTA